MVTRSSVEVPRRLRDSSSTSLLIAGLLLAIFLLDLAFPTGVASGVPYILPVLVALRHPRRGSSLAVGTIATVLAVLGFFLPFPDLTSEPFWLGVENRMIAVGAIWATAVLGHLFVVRDRDARDRELRLQTVVDSTPDLIVALDDRGCIESANAAASRAFGRSAIELEGLPLADLLDPPAASPDGSVTADAVELISEGRTGVGLALLPSSERARTIRWSIRSLDDSGTRLAVGHDLTELLEAQDRAVQSERLAAIGQTLATLSHESKNELLALRFGLEQLGRCWDDRDNVADLISGLLESQGRLWRLFEDLRNYAAPIRLQPSPVLMPDVWRMAWDSLASRAGRNAVLAEHVPDGTSECVVDPFRLEQVFRNLFENSLAACSDPVKIEVTCLDTRWRGEPAVCIRVRDNGPGLPDEARARLFEPFFTTKSSGTGLGLSLCRRIVEAHQGELTASPSDAGAEFVIMLPRRVGTLVEEIEPVHESAR